MPVLGPGWPLAWHRVDLLCHPSHPPGQRHTHLGIKQAAVRGQAGSLVAELSREGRGLRGQEVLSDTHGAYQALHLCQRGGGQRVSGDSGSRNLPLPLLSPRSTSHNHPHPALREPRPWIQHQASQRAWPKLGPREAREGTGRVSIRGHEAQQG